VQLKHLSAEVSSITDMNQQIATTAEEQHSVVESINCNVT